MIISIIIKKKMSVMYLKLIINSYFVSRLDINKNRNLTVPL